jgi:hypothetical protein
MGWCSLLLRSSVTEFVSSSAGWGSFLVALDGVRFLRGWAEFGHCGGWREFGSCEDGALVVVDLRRVISG